MLKHIIHSLFYLLFTCELVAQQASQFTFTRYNTSNGLASNFVNNLIQEDKGYIWLATVNGLQRYDGHKFLTFKNQRGNPSTIPTDNVNYVYEDKVNRLWVITADNKVGIFHTGNFTYQEVPIRYKQQTSLNVNIPKRLFETKEGKLILFMVHYGLYVLDPVAKAFVFTESLIPAPTGWKLNDLFLDSSSGLYWLAADSGLAAYNPATRHLNYRGHNIDHDAIIQQFEKEVHVLEVYTNDKNQFFLSSWPPLLASPFLYAYNKMTGEKLRYHLSEELKIGYHEILGYLKQRNGRLWFYGMPFIAEFKQGENPFEPITNEYKDEQSIKFDKVNNMYEDREGNVWISSDNGVFLFNPDAQLFRSYALVRPGSKSAYESSVLEVLQLKNDQIWVGSWAFGLYCYDTNFNPIQAPAGLKKVTDAWSIWCMIQHNATGFVWIVLQGGGIIVHDPLTGKTDIFSPPVFEGSTIRQVTEDKQGNLWFGTQGGHIVKWDHKLAGKNVKDGYSLLTKRGPVHKAFTSDDGFVWIATLGHGLIKINPVDNSVSNFTTSGPDGKRLSADAPYDIIQYNDSLLMIANGAIDILNTKTNTITSINTENGLPSNNVLCLEKDQHDIIWLGMINGLCRMNLEKKIFTYYDRRDGITYDNFSIAGASQLPNRNLVFTTDHNFLVFDPSNMVPKEPPPDVKITDFIMANRPLLVDSLNKLNKITLAYDKNSVIIGFGTLSYLRKNKKLFYYQLEKIDDDWILADDFHKAIYNYIPPGTYTFKVKCVNGYGITSKNITTLQIQIRPPFWKTWWFYAIVLLLGIALLYYIDKQRIRRLLTLQQVRTEIASNLHHDITTTLNNIHLLSEIAKIKADKDLIKSKEYIDQINTKSRKMIDDMDDMLWSIDPDNDSMEKTLERMQEFAEGLKNTYGCKIQLVVDDKVKSLKLDMKSRHEIYFIFKEALSNIIQHSNCTESIVNIDMVSSNLSVNIHDNGTGLMLRSFEANTVVEEMKKRAAILNAVLDIHSNKRGTSVILQVPIR